MSDFTAQGLYQQRHARPMSGEDLEVLGKTASSKWSSGEYSSLTDSVVAVVKHAHLSPEQVKRVTEFANTAAFLEEFKKEGAPTKVVDFGEGGPADPSEILKDLNDGGGGSVFDAGTLDYDSPPREEKTASVSDENALRAMFGTTPDENIPYAEPLREAIDLRDKLGSAYDKLTSEVSGLEVMYEDLGNALYHQVKQAALGGASLGEISQVLALGVPSEEHLKIAFQQLTPRLLKDGVYSSLQAALDSMDKTASRRVPNLDHPMVSHVREMSECLDKLAHRQVARDEVSDAHATLTTFIKMGGKKEEGAKGAIQRAGKAIKDTAVWAGKHTGEGAGYAKKTLLGGTGEGTKRLVRGAVSHLPEAALAAGAFSAARAASNSPTLRQAHYSAQANLNPASDAWKEKTYRQQGGGY